MKIVANEKNPKDKVASRPKIMPNTFLDFNELNNAFIDNKKTKNIRIAKIFTPM